MRCAWSLWDAVRRSSSETTYSFGSWRFGVVCINKDDWRQTEGGNGRNTTMMDLQAILMGICEDQLVIDSACSDTPYNTHAG